MFYQLPPVGNPICLSQDENTETLFQIFGNTYQPHYFASGTASLAVAIMAASKLKGVKQPEVILPAYGCPDLVSAAVFAGVKPVLVDLEDGRPWMDLDQLQDKINAQTVAIIAVDLFGISERFEQLRILARQVEAVLIEDSAQAFPGNEEKDIWQGDLVVLSFGRGKPVSLLGGGALLVRIDEAGESLAGLLHVSTQSEPVRTGQRFSFRLKAAVYNRMISPWLYWLPLSLPFLHLGETRYHPLTAIEEIDQARLAVLSSNAKAYRGESLSTQNSLLMMLGELNLDELGIIDLPGACKTKKSRRLLRYPLLVRSEARDIIHAELQRQGLGPSRMYPAVLQEIAGLEQILLQHNVFPAATSFADRLLTLPTHSQVSQVDICKISRVLSG